MKIKKEEVAYKQTSKQTSKQANKQEKRWTQKI